jgi:hypothetical protein
MGLQSELMFRLSLAVRMPKPLAIAASETGTAGGNADTLSHRCEQMTASSVPEHSSEANRGRLGRMVISLFDHWNLSSEERAVLLGLAPGNRTFLARYRKGARICTTRDQYDRVRHLLGIHRSLRLLFPRNREVVYGWMKIRNRAFGGMTPVEAIRKYGFVGLLMVRAYLDRVCSQ